MSRLNKKKMLTSVTSITLTKEGHREKRRKKSSGATEYVQQSLQ